MEIIKRLQEIIKDINEFGISAKGKKELLNFCNGNRLNPRQSILAHCYQCLGYYDSLGSDKDCHNPTCPLYPYMPYKLNNEKPKKIRKPMSEEHKRKLLQSRKKYGLRKCNCLPRASENSGRSICVGWGS